MPNEETRRKAIVIGVGPEDGLGGQLCMRFAERGAPRLRCRTDGRERGRAGSEDRRQRHRGRGGRHRRGTGDRPVRCGRGRGGRTHARHLQRRQQHPGPHRGHGGELLRELLARRSVRGLPVRGARPCGACAGAGGTLLFTGASASLRGRPNFGAFNASKGALRNLAQAMAKEYAEEGIHVGHVVVDGPIGGEKIKKGFPEFAERMGEGRMIDNRRHRRLLRVPLQPAPAGVVLRGGREDVAREVVGDGARPVPPPSRSQSTRACALPLSTRSPFWLTVVTSRSTSPSSTFRTVAVASRVSPGHTWLVKRTPYSVSRPSPT